MFSLSPEPSHTGPILRGRRGNTCYNCRRRKIKCDGARPQCTNCERGGATFEDCEYPSEGRPSQVALLEEHIESIKNQIRLLEGPEDTQDISLLPYHSGDNFQGTSGGMSGASSTSHSSTKSPRPSTLTLAEMPQQDRQHHIQGFLSKAHQVGFFLSPDQLWACVVSAGQGEPNVSITLVDAVLTWSSYWSSNFHDAREYLQSATDGLSDGSGLSSSRPNAVLYSIQAEVLISYYLLAMGKTSNGIHHANSALSLTLASGLHRINAPEGRQGSAHLPPPTTVQEAAQRINALWSVISCVTRWAAVSKSDGMLMLMSLQFDSVTTPWPADSDQDISYASERPLDAFLRGTDSTRHSLPTLYVKAGILLERAISLHSDPTGTAVASAKFNHLDNLIRQFKQDLPDIGTVPTSSPATHDKALITHLMALAATIRLHLPYIHDVDTSKQRCVIAAHSIAHLTNTLTVNDIDRQYLDPIIGAAWMSASEVLMPYIISGSLAAEEHANAVASLEAIFGQWNRFAESVEMFATLMVYFEKTCAASFKNGPEFLEAGVAL